MALIVQKFGGSSVKDAECLRRVAGIITNTYKAGNDVIVVVSAQGDTTDDLIEKAKEISKNPSKREMDMLLTTGEQISASLLAMTIEDMGYPAVSLTGWQAGISTNSRYSDSRIKKINTERVNAELDKKRIVIVTGFQGINKYDDMTTLGRGGSDTSAVALAAATHADLCEIYTDVDGVYTTDPRIAPNAKKLKEISYDEMLELASLGANVLHNRSVEMAKKYNVNLCVRSSITGAEGTIVKEVTDVESMMVRGIAKDNDVARISICSIEDTPGKAFRIFSLLAKHNVNVDIILQSIGRDDKKDISFTVTEGKLEEVLAVIEKNKDIIGYGDLNYTTDVSKVSIVGAGMVSNPGVAAKMFEALFDAHINIHMIATSEIKVSVLIDRGLENMAVKAIQQKFEIA